MPPALPAPLVGIVPPLITPLTPDGALDEAAVGRLIERIVAGGAVGVFVLGTTGEGPCLPLAVQEAMVRASVRAAAGRIPVLVGISDAVLADTLELARRATAAGASALVLAPPFYLPAVGADLQRHVEAVLRGTTLPLFLYNMPSLVKTPIPLALLEWAVKQPRIVGFKDSGGDFGYFHKALQIARSRPDFTVYIGPEELLGDAVLFGAHGGVCGGAQIFPRLYVEIDRAARSGDVARLRVLNDVLQAVSKHLYGATGYAATVIRSIKVAAQLKGLAGDTLSEPFGPSTEADRDRVRAALALLDPRMAEVLPEGR